MVSACSSSSSSFLVPQRITILLLLLVAVLAALVLPGNNEGGVGVGGSSLPSPSSAGAARRRLDNSAGAAYDVATERQMATAKAATHIAMISTAAGLAGGQQQLQATNASSWLDSDFMDYLHGGLPLPIALVRRRLRQLAAVEKKMQVADLYGGIYDYAYYFISVLVGTPPQRQSVILDSGSSLLGFPCLDCTHCGKQHIDRGFDFGASSTAQWLHCEDSRCLTKRCGSRATSLMDASVVSVCRYVQSYSEGSSIEGAFFSDVVAIGEERDKSTFIRFDYLGCHDKETNLFTTQKASGIFGVSYPKRGKQPTLIDALFAAPAVDTKVFAICASEEGGRLSVGGFDSSTHLPSLTKAASNRRLLELAQRYRHDMHFRAREQVADVAAEEQQQQTTTGRRLGAAAEQQGATTSREPHDYLEVLRDEIIAGAAEGYSRRLQEEAGATKQQPAKTDLPAAEIAWTSVTSPSAYQIEVKNIAVIPGSKSGQAQEAHDIASAGDIGPVIVDSGTTFSYLASGAFRAFMKALSDACDKSNGHCISKARTASDQLCWSVKSPEDMDFAPSFLLTLGSGAIVEWRPESYLHRRARTDQWCLAVDDNMSRQTILGMSFMKQQEVVFDRERDMVGFVRAACPTVEDKQRPAPPTTAMPGGAAAAAAGMAAATPMALAAVVATSGPDSAAEENWVTQETDAMLVVQTMSGGIDAGFLHSKTGGYNPYMMWASGGLAVTVCVGAMLGITRRSMRRRQDYAPAPLAPPLPPQDAAPAIFAPFEVINVLPDEAPPAGGGAEQGGAADHDGGDDHDAGAASDREKRDALAEAIRDELQLQQQHGHV